MLAVLPASRNLFFQIPYDILWGYDISYLILCVEMTCIEAQVCVIFGQFFHFSDTCRLPSFLGPIFWIPDEFLGGNRLFRRFSFSKMTLINANMR